jgi:ergothioneine biosynthesis protein EgtB
VRDHLIASFRHVRATTEALAEPLSAEDQGVQSLPSCSPTKWHRAHTTWFFETFLLEPRGIAPFDGRWAALYNSYYDALGSRHPRPLRGVLSRPSVSEIATYRRVVDDRVVDLLEQADARSLEAMRSTIELGLAHEEQHQELLLSDILHALHQNPLRPSYRRAPRLAGPQPGGGAPPMRFLPVDGGLVELGAPGGPSFRFDNEEPRHRVFLEPFEVGSRLVTVGEWKAFAAEGGYETPSLWLSDGYDWVRAESGSAPLYAERDGGALLVFGLDGLREAHDDEPIANVSYYEADAIARYCGGRLPTESEWEVAAARAQPDGNFLDDGVLRVLPSREEGGDRAPSQAFGDAWEWTASPYGPYPGFRPPEGAIGEYNGKFMVNQLVLRGGSCLTPRGHARLTYRNFWPPGARVQVAGVRLARSARG